MPQIYLNYYRDNKSDITYNPVIKRDDLEYTKPIFVTEEELNKIKELTVEKIFSLLEANKL
jgi:hypothetical protein